MLYTNLSKFLNKKTITIEVSSVRMTLKSYIIQKIKQAVRPLTVKELVRAYRKTRDGKDSEGSIEKK